MLNYNFQVFIVLICSSQCISFGCSNPKLSDQARTMFYNAHNDARRSLAKGLEPHKCGRLSSGKNVYQLNWNCEMEAKVQEWADSCTNSFQTFDPSWGHNLQTWSGTGLDPVATSANTVNSWWSSVRSQPLTDPENKYTGSPYTFANMAFGKTTEFACAYSTACGSKLYIGCFYNKIGYMTNAVIYEKGDACTSNADCTTYSGSTCNDGLCYVEPTGPIVETYTMCPGVTDMSDQARMAFLNTHNKLRSSLAKGLEPDGIAPGAFAPQAKHMPKMRYNCTIEANARTYALNCVFEHSKPEQRPQCGENLYYRGSTNYPKILSGEDASNAWWSELPDIGVGSENRMTSQLFSTGVGHYTQMAWDRTTDLGCYVAHCPSMTYSVCQYYTPGNYMNEMIYEVGPPCTQDSDCPGSQTCSVSESLCILS
ncbi:unnamed protein product [Caenorhabditis bovis]|uniref:SCP domain-containing protein n=1 Tax=Caenorhabditis bovis TaxID=2654633 RepID=A0A8S1EQS3_9PELO|nr:unnamed protein product [Caenorhabditis bovis]